MLGAAHCGELFLLGASALSSYTARQDERVNKEAAERRTRRLLTD